ncbi:hypothetical protein Bca52824_032840 [Brassica carinata]|uniref:Uncharacterized protein n=1 Tax=Brassica carinata TaxID=52824 RepID=A0A8X7SBT2_BRACI|nr:hypothetical protein Bca52824_032840 [Brassica carinata]
MNDFAFLKGFGSVFAPAHNFTASDLHSGFNPLSDDLNRRVTDPQGEDEDQYPEDATERTKQYEPFRETGDTCLGGGGVNVSRGGDMRTLGVLIPNPIGIFPFVTFQKSRI